MRLAVIFFCAIVLAVSALNETCASPVERSPRIALIIDDFGYSFSSGTLAFLELDVSLTISVIPGLRYSERVAEKARSEGKAVLAHLPMEPLDYPAHDPGPGAIFTSQSDEEIRAAVRGALDSFSRIDGVNNHMGSRAMRDGRVLGIVLDEVGKRGLFFLDSKTVASRKAVRIARKNGVKCLENDLFWDTGYDTEEEIEAHLDELARIALRRGWAVGIGHPRGATLEALKRKLPEFEKLGILLVPVTELVRDAAWPGGGGPRGAGKKTTGDGAVAADSS